MDIKLAFAVIATILSLIVAAPYIVSIFKGQTKPHIYTWLIWTLTQGIATFAVIHGGGKFGSISLFIGSIMVFFIFLISLKYGTKDITRSDMVALIFALIAINHMVAV